jgi:hypothetical protein
MIPIHFSGFGFELTLAPGVERVAEREGSAFFHPYRCHHPRASMGGQSRTRFRDPDLAMKFHNLSQMIGPDLCVIGPTGVHHPQVLKGLQLHYSLLYLFHSSMECPCLPHQLQFSLDKPDDGLNLQKSHHPRQDGDQRIGSATHSDVFHRIQHCQEMRPRSHFPHQSDYFAQAGAFASGLGSSPDLESKG